MADSAAGYYGYAVPPTSRQFPEVNFDWAGDLQKNFQEGFNNQRERALANAFPNGPPRNPDGSINTQAITDTMFKLGGAQFGSGVAQQYIGADIFRQLMGESGGPAGGAGGPGTGAPAPMSQPQGGGPPFAPNASRQSTNGTGPANLSSAGTDNSGVPTLAAIGSEVFGERNVEGLLRTIGKGMGVSIDQQLSPEQVTQAKAALQKFAGKTAMRTQTDAALQQTPQENSTAERAANTGGQTAAAPAGAGPQVVQAGSDLGTATLGGDSETIASRMEQAADHLRRQAAALSAAGFKPESSKATLDRAEALSKQAQEMRARIAKQKETMLGVDVKRQEQLTEGDIKTGQAAYKGMQAAAAQYERGGKDFVTLSKSILNDPSMYSGIGANAVLDFNKVRAALGDAKAAMLQEGLQKVTAASVLNQINEQRDQLMEAGGQSSRIFSQQIDLVNKASPSITNTVTGNRMLAEITGRLGEQSARVAEFARNWLAQQPPSRRYLDQRFDGALSDYLKAHPIFSAQERAHPELLGAPTHPAGIAIIPWAQAMGLKPGDAFRTPDGRLKAVPGPKI